MMDEIFKISKDIDRARDLYQISKERIDIIKILPRNKPYKISTFLVGPKMGQSPIFKIL